LQNALLNGEVLPLVKLRLRESTFGGSDRQALRVDFTDVTVCGVETTGALFKNTTAVTELVTLRFKTISWVYRTAGPAATTSSYVYDLIYGTGDGDLDSDRDGLRNDVDPDDDNDGIPDSAEIMMRSNPITNDSGGDSDFDGSTNFEEYLAGTDAFDSNSFFGVERITLDLSQRPPVASVSIPTIGGRQYRVLASDNLAGPVSRWMEIDRFVTEDDEAPSVAEVDIGPGGAQMLDRLLFRVEVDLPPLAN